MVEDETVPLSHRTSCRPHLGWSPILDNRLGGGGNECEEGNGCQDIGGSSALISLFKMATSTGQGGERKGVGWLYPHLSQGTN